MSSNREFYQQSLFLNADDCAQAAPEQSIHIQGLQYIPTFISAEEETELLRQIDGNPWLTELKRRVQHYGYRYDYKARHVDPDMYLGPLPDWVQPLNQRLLEARYFPAIPDQLIVNEYEPGQGISAHVDCVPCFGPVVCSVSLGSPCVMLFTSVSDEEEASMLLEPRSLLVMSGISRYGWKHAIPARKTDKISGRIIMRQRRVSLTFRSVVIGQG